MFPEEIVGIHEPESDSVNRAAICAIMKMQVVSYCTVVTGVYIEKFSGICGAFFKIE